MTEQLPPNREHELADRSYRMVAYTWFRIVGKMAQLAYPYYLGRGIAFNPAYNIRDVWQEPMPDHVVIKIALTKGGGIATNTQKRPIQPGEAIIRFVEDDDIWEGYHPQHRGTWEFLGLILTGESGVATARGIMNRYGRLHSLGLDHLVVRRLQQILRDAQVVTEMSASAGAKLVNDVLMALLESAEAKSLERIGRVVDLADLVEADLRNDLRRDWSVAELAELHNVSREHLTRVFSRRFGVSPHRYLVELRIQEACKRLRSTADPIKRIVFDLGFKSHASFIRVFRQYTHTSPTSYREGH